MSSNPVELPGDGTQVASTNDNAGDAVQHVFLHGYAPGGGPQPVTIGAVGDSWEGFPMSDVGDLAVSALAVQACYPTLGLMGATDKVFWPTTAYTAGQLLAPPLLFRSFVSSNFHSIGAFEILNLAMIDFTDTIDSTSTFLLGVSNGSAVETVEADVGDDWDPSPFQALFTLARFADPEVIPRTGYNEVVWPVPAGTTLSIPYVGAPSDLYGVVIAGDSGSSAATDPGGGLFPVQCVIQTRVTSYLIDPDTGSSS